MPSAWGDRLGLAFGGLLLAFGVVELITHLGDAGALVFWSVSLFGGGALVLGSFAVRARHPRASLAMLLVGAALGVNATIWSVLVPVLGIAAVVLIVRNRSAVAGAQSPNASA
jgi:hypothetical protein